MEIKDYYIGIDYGTSNSCVGIYMNSVVQIAPNRIGERTTPSLVSFIDDKIFVGEETLNQKIEGSNLIYEVKRFIGLDYEELIKSDFAKNLNYDIINQDGKPLIKVFFKGKEEFYSPEEISAFIIKKIVSNAEDFINDKELGVKITKAVLTVPVNFTKKQKDALNAAARLADLEIIRIINEPTAAALAYGLNKEDLNIENEPPLSEMKIKKEEYIIVFDLGGGTFDMTLLNIRKKNNYDFEVIGNKGNPHLGGSDFDNMLLDYCIKKLCEYTGLNETDIRENKNECKRLKIKCEAAKKLLSEANEAYINLDNLFDKEDICIKITREKFESICKHLFDKIKLIINDLLTEKKKEPKDIDSVILIGGATKMIGIKNILNTIFGENKIKYNINPDETVAYGATLQCAKIEEKDKINFNLQDIIPYNLGIAVKNQNKNEDKELMYTIIKKNSKIPYNSDAFPFTITLDEKTKDINVNIYEGNDKYAENNNRLEVLTIKDVNKIGPIDYTVQFMVDVDCKLTVNIIIKSLQKIFTKKIENDITNAFVDRNRKRIKINKNKSITMKSVIYLINSIKKSIAESKDTNIKLEKLIDCCKGYEQLVNNYMIFAKENEFALEKVFYYTKLLFYVYLDRILLNDDKKDNIQEIINNIKKYMENIISVVGYIIYLLDIFQTINNKDINCKNIFCQIFTNFMELMNEEGNKRMKNLKYSRYFSQLYYEKAFYCYKKYFKECDLTKVDREIKHKLEEQILINKKKLNEIKSYAVVVDSLAKEQKFLVGNNTGYTFMVNQIEKLNDPDSLSVDELKQLLDLFKKMDEIYEIKEKSLEDAYCIANIIKIHYKLLKYDITDKLIEYLDKFNFIMEEREDEQYNWYKEIKEIINEIEMKNN